MIKIMINTENDAFDEEFSDGKSCEVARILRKLADRIENGDCPEKLYDINGNAAGTVEY